METLVTTEWLSQHLADPDLVVLDCSVFVSPEAAGDRRVVNGRGPYAAGHIPGAGFADLLGDLSDPDSPWMLALPAPERLCAVFGALGVGDDTRVVLYDAAGSIWAARVWWMLRWLGFDRAALLDGGQQLWVAEGRQLSAAAAAPTTRRLTPRVRPELVVDRDEVFAVLDQPAVCLVDALDSGSYQAGHIPGAINVDARELLDATGRFRPLTELASRFPADPTTRVITYCGGGIAAASDAFILTRLGFTNVAVYVTSLQEWAADPANPLVTGPR